ncbi:universal stress protein, partial [Hymenobacter sp. BT770]|uniref:universal stress protein n=1 Tax=Hymenobacter sp. BT770 TaxID=2886942 RepID=UPI001D11549F
MEPTFVVLTDLSAAAEAASTYTSRLATLMGGQVVLLHVYHDPLLEPEAAMMAVPALEANRQQALTELVQRAQQLPVPGKAEMSEESLEVALQQAISQYHPLLLAAGREAPHTALDRLVANLALPALRQARYP